MKKITIILSCLVIVFMVTGCGQTNQPNTKEPIKIGFVGPLTGDIANLGTVIRAAVQVAVEEVNNQGGIQGRKLEVDYEDGVCDAKQANLAGNKLINIEKVPVIIGGTCSGETLAIAPLAEANKTVLLSPASTNSKITDSGDYIFRLVPSDSYQGKFSAEYIVNGLKFKRVAILYDSDVEWSIGIKEEFKSHLAELGGNVVVEVGVLNNSRDLRTEIVKIKASNPEVIYFPSYTDSGIIGLMQFKEMGLNIPVIGGDVWDDISIPQKAGEAANSVRYTVAANYSLPDYFIKGVKEITGNDDMNTYAPRAYDAIKILAQIINKVGTDSEKIKTELYKLKDYHGLADTYSFDQNGDVTQAKYSVKEFQNGKIITLQ